MTERYESEDWVESLTPFIELLQVKFSPFVASLILVQKELKLLILRMNIGGGGLTVFGVDSVGSDTSSMSD